MTRLKEKKNEKANLTDSHFKSKTSKKFRNESTENMLLSVSV